jgi:acyl-CoA hydrolase
MLFLSSDDLSQRLTLRSTVEITSRFLKIWTEGLQDCLLNLFDSGNLDLATATLIRFSPGGFQRFYVQKLVTG